MAKYFRNILFVYFYETNIYHKGIFFLLIIFPTIQSYKLKYSYEKICERFLVLIVLNINFGIILETCGEKADFLHWNFSKLLKFGLESIFTLSSKSLEG